ncbi:MAG: CXXX repeat peptide maturase [Paludibacteraceae bacterium]|nr:CXXX repeat peptide maturase [Paludibacteraceae bacterium]
MLQYLVILLDDTSVAYCHACNPLTERNLMPLDTLKKAILFGMKENLMIQYVYPDYDLPEQYEAVLESIDNVKIWGESSAATQHAALENMDVIIYNSVPDAIATKNAVLRLPIKEFIAKQYDIAALLPHVKRLNICLTDIENFNDGQIKDYSKALGTLNAVLLNLFKSGKQPQLNILTDRLQLTEMHNCGAGVSNITVAPNGKFYLCPAFYYDERTGVSNRMNHSKPSSERNVGNLDSGLDIPNQQLLKLDHAPLCRNCDAYHCNRCIWLNQKLTWDNNTPSHQQCMLAHIERNASRDLQQLLTAAEVSAGEEIKQIDYLDPFDVKKEW